MIYITTTEPCARRIRGEAINLGVDTSASPRRETTSPVYNLYMVQWLSNSFDLQPLEGDMHGTNGIVPVCLRLYDEGASMWPMLSGGVFNYRSSDQKMADALGIMSRDEYWEFFLAQ